MSAWLADDAAPYWGAAAAAVCVAIGAGVGDWRRKRRADLDRVGLIDWPTLQMLALIAGAICVTIALHD